MVTEMANPELVELLKQGSEAWNRWREQQAEHLIIDLNEADLTDVNLRYANLHNANLSSANLSSVNLSCANLSSVNLSCANLSRADLYDIHLGRANLSRANLSRARLIKVNLSGAHLKESNWTYTRIGWTQFGDLDLRRVIGLETVQHEGSSTIGLDTIYRSHGQIPESFLRGAGVPEPFITNMRALVNAMSPLEFYSCFISYSHQDENFAKRLYADLQREGVRCWYAPEDLKIGDHYHQRIDEAIRLYDRLILVLSDAAVRSAWVEREMVAAREKEDQQQREVLFPLRLDDAVMETNQAWAADVRRRWHIGNFTCWKDHDRYQQAFERLLRDLKAERKGGREQWLI
jgi:TIR domain/Pentapeptide repeats (8 copies)